MIPVMLAMVAASPGAVVTLSGRAVVSNTGAGTQTAGLRFNSDGTVDEFETATGWQQYSTATDWIIPNDRASSNYEIRVQSAPPGDAFTNSPVADGSWIDLGTTREWDIVDPTNNATAKDTGNFTVEIRKSGGSVIASGTYSLYADRQS